MLRSLKVVNLTEISELLATFIAFLGGIVTVYTYWKNSSLKRAEWLYELYEKYYEAKYYKEMRLMIDYGRKEQIEMLKNAIENDCEDKLVEELVDYLNFFEFIASLWKLGQLPLKEIAMVFEYYILRIGDYDFLNKFLVDQHFHHLPELIKVLRNKKAN